MRKIGMVLAVMAGISVCGAVAAQPSADARYCAELTRLYRTYVNNPEDPRPAQASPRATDEVAISNCQAGNTAAGIPPLEKALKDNRFTLPPRS
jgi:hypothetical protein